MRSGMTGKLSAFVTGLVGVAFAISLTVSAQAEQAENAANNDVPYMFAADHDQAARLQVAANTGSALAPATQLEDGADPHANVYQDTPFPSAAACGRCHLQVFQEWSSSNHAYASISPMFHKFEQAVNDLTAGTIGSFCVRCHQQVGTQLGEKRELPLWERSPVAREGITCVTCHRVGQSFFKVNGERHIRPGNVSDPVYGAGVAENLAEVIENRDYYQIAKEGETPTSEKPPVHLAAIEFDQISQSEFCVSCHQVAVNLGIKLEVVWDQYRDSPALREGITCQDCHMGKVPGEPLGYEMAPVAIVNGRPVGEPKKHSNHSFYGPGYPIGHPGIFPFTIEGLRWTIKQWLLFDYRSDWGKPTFEADLAAGKIEAPEFPEPWDDRASREIARIIIDKNRLVLNRKRRERIAVMENGSRLEGPFFANEGELRTGEDLNITYRIKNVDKGHNLPSGSLGAQPEIWMNVALIDPDGNVAWETGYVDSNGDMADLHSLDVAAGTIEHDDQLVNLQTKFLTTNIKGTDREMYLPVQFDVDQRPMLRPAPQPTTVLNHPPLVRMEGRSIPPLGYRDAKYKIPAEVMTKPGTYKLQARMRSRAEPIYFMRFVGATREMERNINEDMIDIHPQAVTFEVR